MKIRSLCAGLACATTVFAASGVYAAAPYASPLILAADDEHSSSVGQQLDDSVITAKVKAALLKPDNGVSGLSVEVSTNKGEVELSGVVDNSDQALTATRIAQGVEGVKSVRNNLRIKGESS